MTAAAARVESSIFYIETLRRKLRAHAEISEDDIAAFETLPVHLKDVAPNTPIVLDGDRPSQCCIVVGGFAIRSKPTDAGKRQILSVHIPGDIPDLQSLPLPVMDHDLKSLSHCRLAFIPHDAVRSLTRARPAIADMLWRETLV